MPRKRLFLVLLPSHLLPPMAQSSQQRAGGGRGVVGGNTGVKQKPEMGRRELILTPFLPSLSLPSTCFSFVLRPQNPPPRPCEPLWLPVPLPCAPLGPQRPFHHASAPCPALSQHVRSPWPPAKAWGCQQRPRRKSHRSVGFLLPSVLGGFAWLRRALHMHRVDDVKEIFHHSDPLQSDALRLRQAICPLRQGGQAVLVSG